MVCDPSRIFFHNGHSMDRADRLYAPLRCINILVLLIVMAALTACEPPAPATPRPTAQAILEITPAPTFDIDATATSYARRLIPSPTPAGLYIVQPGDTLSALALDFGTTVEDLMAANGLTDPNAIQVGQPLIIPSLVDRPQATTQAISTTATLEIASPTNVLTPTP